ncbi:MAG: hypothetical protein IKR25_07835, partial [Muribaculaceae bacterium]|nr:hypothetical protein [Muribaculaceae bacterium]
GKTADNHRNRGLKQILISWKMASAVSEATHGYPTNLIQHENSTFCGIKGYQFFSYQFSVNSSQ